MTTSVERVTLIGGPQDGLEYVTAKTNDGLVMRLIPQSVRDMTELQAIRRKAGEPFEVTCAIYQRVPGTKLFDHVGYEREMFDEQGLKEMGVESDEDEVDGYDDGYGDDEPEEFSF